MNFKIAIISTNKDQYSETFIRNHVAHLPYKVLLLSEGYLPKEYSTDRGAHFQKIPNKLFSKEPNIKKLLLKEKISAVFAEYGPSGVEILPIVKEAKLPLIVHFHGYDAFRSDILNSYGKYYSELFDYASALVVVSNQMREQLMRLGCPEIKIHLIKNGVDENKFVPKEVEKKPQFIFCGRFVAKKSPITTIQAFNKVLTEYSNASLVMVGDGPLLNECQALVSSLGIEGSVKFTGVLKQEDIIRHLQESLAFVQHSVQTKDNDSEGAPISIMEAALCGLAVISTRHAAIPEIIVDGKGGLLCDENDMQSMSQNMLQMLTNQEQAKAMGAFSREYVAKNYNLSQNIHHLSRIIESSISG